jgi:hypothetical protein
VACWAGNTRQGKASHRGHRGGGQWPGVLWATPWHLGGKHTPGESIAKRSQRSQRGMASGRVFFGRLRRLLGEKYTLGGPGRVRLPRTGPSRVVSPDNVSPHDRAARGRRIENEHETIYFGDDVVGRGDAGSRFGRSLTLSGASPYLRRGVPQDRVARDQSSRRIIAAGGCRRHALTPIRRYADTIPPRWTPWLSGREPRDRGQHRTEVALTRSVGAGYGL